MLTIIIEKIFMGIMLAAPIGPVNAEMIKRGLTVGFWGSFSVRLGGAMANSLMLLLAYFGLGELINYPRLIASISILGSGVLLFIGAKNILKTNLHFTPITETQSEQKQVITPKKQNYSISNGLLTGFSLSFASPIGLMFWLGTFATTMQQAGLPVGFNLHDLLINFFIIVGVLLWGLLISIILHFSSKFIDHKKLKIVNILSGIILIGFGIKYLVHNIPRIMI